MLPHHDDTTKIPVYNPGGHRFKKGAQVTKAGIP